MNQCGSDASYNTYMRIPSPPAPSPPPSPGGRDCLCIFDIDRTLTGKQGDTQRCPANSIQSGVYDSAYDRGDLTLSELTQKVAGTFCSKCHLGTISAGDANGNGSAERAVLHDRLAVADSDLPSEWSQPGCSVTSPLVTSCADGQKQHAVPGIIQWYKQSMGAQIADGDVYFFDDRSDNIEPFRSLGYNARQISCATRDRGGSIGYCGAELSEITATLGVTVCGEAPTVSPSPSSDSYTEYTSKTAYRGHGGDEIDSEDTAPSGLTVSSCEDRCNYDNACSCVSFRPSDGKCWKRGNCIPSLFGSDSHFNTYVKSSSPSPAPTPVGTVDVTTLHWNVHRPCGTDNSNCISLAQQRLGQIASEVGAKVVGVVELKNAVDALPGWQSTGMQCDNSAVMVAPGWSISKSGGYCMNQDSAKGFAVALVTPDEPVYGCPALCIIMGHVPHSSGSAISGHSEIASVCGDAVGSCSIMMGDWNAEDIGSRWNSLIGGSTTLVEPHDITCCYPDYKYRFDHTATNIQGAISTGKTVYDPQLTRFPSYNEHKPTSVQLRLPGLSSASPEFIFVA